MKNAVKTAKFNRSNMKMPEYVEYKVTERTDYEPGVNIQFHFEDEYEKYIPFPLRNMVFNKYDTRRLIETLCTDTQEFRCFPFNCMELTEQETEDLVKDLRECLELSFIYFDR